jgi:two-component system chemotaxis response regulator CheY
MLVDDSATIRASLEAMLSLSGFRVETASGGADALRKMASHPPDVIITDLNMPEMDGIEFIHELRQTAALRFTPVLLLTNESQRTRRDAAKAAGATGWIVKPIKALDLLDVLRKVTPVDRSRA